jgi:hypothetical protein
VQKEAHWDKHGKEPSLHLSPYILDTSIVLLSMFLSLFRSDITHEFLFLYLCSVTLSEVGKLNFAMFSLSRLRLYLFISENPEAVYFD